MTSKRLIAVALAYCIGTVALYALGAPHLRLMLLVVQHAFVLPCVVVALRGDPTRSPAHGVANDVAPIVWLVAAAATSIAVIAIARVWDHAIMWGDESSYRMQADLFAAGRPWADAPAATSPDPATSAAELHFNHLIIHDGHWFSKYPPLWPAVLSLGVLAHVRWLVNPLLAVVALVILHRLARRELTVPARLALLVTVTSPFFFMMAASQMSHVLGLVCVGGAVLSLFAGVRTRRLSGYLGAVALLGVCYFVRPFTAFCATLAIAPFYLNRRVRGAIAWGAAIAAVVVAGIGVYQYAYTGHVTQSPYALYRDASMPIELSASPSLLAHNLVRDLRWYVEETTVFMWPLVFALAGYGLYRDRRWQHKLLAALWLVFVTADLFMTEGSAPRFGDRYLFEAVFAPVLLGTRGLALLVERFRTPSRMLNLTVALVTVMGAVQAAVLLAPTVRELGPYVRVHAAVDRLPDDGSLVYFPITPAFTGDRFDLNMPDWRHAPHMFLVDPGPARRDAVAAAQGRSSWIVIDERAQIIARGP